ncbi:MAG: hypothetical protein ABIA63_13955, partial [bacterium]
EIIEHIPDWLKKLLKILRNKIRKYSNNFSYCISYKEIAYSPDFRNIKDEKLYQYYIDFVSWYINSMTLWAEFWAKTAREKFPHNNIELVTGGTGNSVLGADFAELCKMVSKYNAGIRITNETENYKESFLLSGLVAGSARFYKSYFSTEEGWVNTPKGVTARIFNAVTSGAHGFYCKNFITVDLHVCSRFSSIGKVTSCAESLRKNISVLKTPFTSCRELAVVFPKKQVWLNINVLIRFYNLCNALRNVTDFEMIDETMIMDGALEKFKMAVVFFDNYLSHGINCNLTGWLNNGGIIIDLQFLGNRDYLAGQRTAKSEYHIEPCKNGYKVLTCGNIPNPSELGDIIFNKNNRYPWKGIPGIPGDNSGIFTSRNQDKTIVFNEGKRSRTVPEFKTRLKPYEIKVLDGIL